MSTYSSFLNTYAGLSQVEASSFIEAVLHASTEVQVALHPESTIVQYCSPNIKTQYGYALHALNGTDFTVLVHPDDRGNFRSKIGLSLQSPGTSVKGECRLKYARKGYHFVEYTAVAPTAGSAFKGLMVNLRDITDKMVMFRALSGSREHLDLAVHAAGLGIWDWNLKEDRIFYNQVWANMLGYRHEEINGNLGFWEEVLHPDDRERVNKAINAHLEGNTALYQEEYRLRNQSGQYIWVLDIGKVMERDNSGQPIRMAGIHQNITTRKAAEEQLLAQKDRLEKVNMELEELAYITSHNLRAPLANLEGLLEVFQSEELADRNMDDMLSRFEVSIHDLKSSLETMEQVVGLYTDPHAGEKEVSFEAAFRLAAAPFKGKLSGLGASVTIDFSQAPEIRYPRAHLVRMFSTLLSNALQYHKPGRPLKIVVTSAADGPYRAIEFRDNGVGIDLDQHGDKLFLIHQRFSPQGSGKGLGLFMLKKLVTYLGGRVEVESTVDQGAAFRLFLLNQDGESYD